MRILVTGATGYVGGRLVPCLLEAGHQVRCLSRSPEKLRDVPWAGAVEIVQGDAMDAASLARGLEGVEVAYYLVHSIGSGPRFSDADRKAASAMAQAAASTGVGRIVYLGGLVPSEGTASPHLASRAEVGQILLDGVVPAVVLQAGVVLGAGSASFEMLRYLTERLPVMVTPRWVDSRVQPIAVEDVLRYLVGALDLPAGTNRRFDVGGPDVLTYRQMMQRYARVAGLGRRYVVPVPVLSPWLSSQWVNVVTPVPRTLAVPLIESLRNSVVVAESDITRLVPFDPLPFDAAVERALTNQRDGDVATRWADAAWPDSPSDPMPSDPSWSGGSAYRDERAAPVDASFEALWRTIEGIGGERGWYSFPLAWSVRGLLDRLVGGVGLRRGRRHRDVLRAGEPVDFWRVEALERCRLLRLRAEMRLPGEAWLEFRVEESDGRPVLHQRALFVPRGVLGHLYWWAVAPFHGVVFGSMLRNLAAAAAGADHRADAPLPA